MIIVIDNYDSFTYNLVQYIGHFGKEVLVVRNDQTGIHELAELKPEHIVISPGPGYPDKAGITLQAITYFQGQVPIFGVCLGIQSIAQAMGGRVVPAPRLMHGKSSPIYHDNRTVFSGIKNPFQGGRYHSLIVDRQTLPGCLEISAETAEGEIMGVRHKDFPLEGVQFHPESIMTECGYDLIENFIMN